MKEKITSTQRALNLWAIVLIIWSIYRVKVKMPEWFDEFIAKPSVFILPVLYYIKRYEKTDIRSAIGFKSKSLKNDMIMGIFIGIILVASAVLAYFLRTHTLKLPQLTVRWEQAVIILLLAFATSVSEEILSRGFILKRLYAESKNVFTATFFSSILFFFLHVPILFTNAKLTGNLLLMFMATDLMLSFVNSITFLQTNSLILPIFIHAMYNAVIMLFI